MPNRSRTSKSCRQLHFRVKWLLYTHVITNDANVCMCSCPRLCTLHIYVCACHHWKNERWQSNVGWSSKDPRSKVYVYVCATCCLELLLFAYACMSSSIARTSCTYTLQHCMYVHIYKCIPMHVAQVCFRQPLVCSWSDLCMLLVWGHDMHVWLNSECI